MTQEIILTKSEKKLKGQVTLAGAKSRVKKLGWWIAVIPLITIFISCLQVVFMSSILLGLLSLFSVVALMLLVKSSVKYMRTFFGANLARSAWAVGSFFFGPVSCLYLFVCRKNVKNNEKLDKSFLSQAVISAIGWGIDILIVLPIVLFVGATASISQTINTQRVNVISNEVAQIVTNVRTLYAEYDDFSGLGEKQIKSGVDGLSYVVSVNSGNARIFDVFITGLSKKDCLYLAGAKWIDSVGYNVTGGQNGGALGNCTLGENQNLVRITYGE